jgi:hypothetical protein
MPTFALLKNVSFVFNNTFESLTHEIISNTIKDNIEFITFTDTCDLFTKIHSIFSSQSLEIDIDNSYYNDTFLYQGFYNFTQDTVHKNFVLTKRKILENDSYTYIDFNYDIPDIHTYYDITLSDIVNIIRCKYIHLGIMLCSTGEIKEYEYITTYNTDTYCGKLLLSNNTEFSFINIANILHLSETKTNTNTNTEINTEIDIDTEKSELLHKKISESGTDYIYTQKKINIGLIDCYCKFSGTDRKNEIASKFFNDDVFGDLFFSMENIFNDDNRSLNLTSDMFKKIINLTSQFKPKNTLFFNIYYELS